MPILKKGERWEPGFPVDGHFLPLKDDARTHDQKIFP